MSKDALIEKIEAFVKPIVSDLDYILYHIEYVKENGEFYLRIYIDKEEGRISLNDCEAVSRRVSEILDVEDPIEGAYYLEVSSPGLNRSLHTKSHFESVLDKEVMVRFNGTIEGVKNIKGILKEVGEDYIIVEGEKTIKIPNDKIKSANLEGEI